MPEAPSSPHRPDPGASADEGHVSGIVVNAVPDHAESVADRIHALDGAEVVAREGGRLIVVLEAADEHGLADLVNRISLFENVYSASLAAHYIDGPAEEGPTWEKELAHEDHPTGGDQS